MHGKKRLEYKAKLRDTKTAQFLETKAQQWHVLMAELANRRKESPPSKDVTSTLQMLYKALVINPDPLHLWNHRRECLLTLPAPLANVVGGNATTSNQILAQELTLTQTALERNPKSYGAWFHRKWSLRQYNVDVSMDHLRKELVLTAQFLTLDERNFHGWNYRRFVVGCLLTSAGPSASVSNGAWMGVNSMGPQIASDIANSKIEEHQTSTVLTSSQLQMLESELQFSLQKIQDNFSNFSAYAYRSQLLPYLNSSQRSDNPWWEVELEILENAMCTEPDDQTSWWYHSILLHHLFHKQIPGLQERLETQHLELLQELHQDYPTCKWIVLGMYHVLDFLQQDKSRRKSLLQLLSTLDPDRQERYQSLAE